MNTCGYTCFPASNPGDGLASYDCAHDKKQHYDIDGESVGCEECEEIADAPIGYHEVECALFPIRVDHDGIAARRK